MATPAPTDPLLLPAHQPTPLDAQARAALKPVTWHELIANCVVGVRPRPYWQGKSAEGIWSVSPRGEGRDRVYGLSFFPKASPQERKEASAIMDSQESKTIEWHLAFGRTHAVEFGYAFTPELALGWPDLMRFQAPGVDVAAALLAAGFQENPPSAFEWAQPNPNDPTKHYTKKINRSDLTLSVGPYGCKLEFHRRSSHSWLNLCRIELVKAAYDGKVYPMVWPGVVAEPAAIAVLGALQAAQEFEAQENARFLARKAKKDAKALSAIQG